MKPYGFKKKTPRGDGCFHCTQDRKSTKTANRHKVHLQIEKGLKEAAEGKLVYLGSFKKYL